MSARIVDADSGGPLTTSKSGIRYMSDSVSLIKLGVEIIWIGVNRCKQGWHDKMANSIVVRPSVVEPVKFSPDSYWRCPSQKPRF
jgi:uncharacterized RDD family membrane protein YckC